MLSIWSGSRVSRTVRSNGSLMSIVPRFRMRFVANIGLIYRTVAATCAARLRNFLDKGPTVTMSAQPSPVTPGATEDGEIDVDITPDFSNFGIEPNPSAQRKIPSDWTSIDRILDVRYSDGQGGDGWVDSDKVRFKVRPEEAPYLSRANECLFKWKSLSYGDGASRPALFVPASGV